MTDSPSIEEREDGPLVVKGVDRLSGAYGDLQAKPVMALCRCGHSANKPFCDGSHQRAGFESRGGKPAGPDRVFTYAGTETTVSYNPRLCSHAAECGRIASNIFNTQQKPWVQPDNGTREEVEAVVRACPSGALKIMADNGEGADLFPEAPGITIQKDGPYWVLDIAAPVEPQGIGMSARKYVLCRCGKSGNKPFCDGTHRDEGWSDEG